MNNTPQPPLLSVRLMAYNHGPFIEEAITGVLKQQTNFPVEIVIGDDFSTDQTLAVAKSMEDTQNISLRILDRKKGDAYHTKRLALGRLYNFRDIVENCKGKYVALLDGDDCWKDVQKLQKQVDFLETHPAYSMSFHNVSTIDDEGKVIDSDFLKTSKPERSKTEMITGAIMPTCSVVFRNNVEFPENFTRANNGDTFLFSLLAQHGKAYFHKDVENACYRVHNAGVWTTAGISAKRRNSLKTYQEIIKVTPKKYYPALYRILASTHFSILKTSPSTLEKLKSFGGVLKYLAFYALSKFLKINV